MIEMFWATTPDVIELRVFFGDAIYPAIAGQGRLAEIETPCHWSAPGICSAPACVDRAYPEACALVDRMLLEELAA
jgi:hypothetical protein